MKTTNFIREAAQDFSPSALREIEDHAAMVARNFNDLKLTANAEELAAIESFSILASACRQMIALQNFGK